MSTLLEMQNYESFSLKQWFTEHYETIIPEIKNHEHYWPGCRQSYVKTFFENNQELWYKFAREIENKKCLEIGSGCTGSAIFWDFINDWNVIDPLVEQYVIDTASISGEEIWRSNIRRYNHGAEKTIRDMIDQVNGCIVCRNSLDHSLDPFGILDNISLYAQRGCYLLLWSDIYHLKGCDKGHRNITREKENIRKHIENGGFSIIRETPNVRQDKSTIEFGCFAVKG